MAKPKFVEVNEDLLDPTERKLTQVCRNLLDAFDTMEKVGKKKYKGLRRGKDGKLLLSEAEITKQCVEFLRAKGWTCLRLMAGGVRGATGGAFIKLAEKGTADWICVRGWPNISVLFLEMKRSEGGRLSPDQARWQKDIRARKLPCWTISDYDEFRRRYAGSYENV